MGEGMGERGAPSAVGVALALVREMYGEDKMREVAGPMVMTSNSLWISPLSSSPAQQSRRHAGCRAEPVAMPVKLQQQPCCVTKQRVVFMSWFVDGLCSVVLC